MFKIEIKNLSDELVGMGSFETMELAQSWLDKQLAKPRYLGLKAKQTALPEMVTNVITPAYNEDIPEVVDTEGNILSEAKTIFHQAVTEEVLNPLLGDTLATVVYELTNDLGEINRVFDIKAEYTYEIIDLNQDPEYQLKVCIENRIKEYPTMDEVLHIILDHGVDSLEYTDMQTLRETIKTKYPKPIN